MTYKSIFASKITSIVVNWQLVSLYAIIIEDELRIASVFLITIFQVLILYFELIGVIIYENNCGLPHAKYERSDDCNL